MDRSLAARPTRPFGARAARVRRRAGRRRLQLSALLPRGARARLALVCVLIALPLLGGGWLLLRNSPLVSVSHVRITGLSGPQAGAIEAALTSTARHMSTLGVNVAALRSAVAPFHLVRAIHVTTSFPHGLRIAVEQEVAVAALLVGGTRTAVAADGVVLGPALVRGSLPTVQASSAPAVGARVSNYYAQVAVTVIGAAPSPLARLIQRAFLAQQGVALELRGGLVAYFGDASRPHAKWLSLARVLADQSSSGATYVDVRLPERPAAGFNSTEQSVVEQPATSTAAAGAGSAKSPSIRESSIQALAEGLGAPSGNAAANAAAAAGQSTSTTESSEATSGAGSSHEGTSTTPESGAGTHESEASPRSGEASSSTGG
jgi:cell division protein FtsQ